MFTKDQLVTVINLWSRGDIDSKLSTKVSFTVQELIVHSCGKKQMILRDEAGTIFKGRNYLPQTEQHTKFHQVLPRMDRDEALALANQLTLEYCATEAANYTNRVVRGNETRQDPRWIERMQQQADHYASNPVDPAFMYGGKV